MEADAMDTLYDLLSARRRRLALRVLTAASEPLDRAELARGILANRRPVHGIAAGDRPTADEVEVSLGHVHLPKLVDCGLVGRTADGRYELTTLGGATERAARAFEDSIDRDTSARNGSVLGDGTHRRGADESLLHNDDDCFEDR